LGWRGVWAGAVVTILFAAFLYPVLTTYNRTNGFSNPRMLDGLDALPSDERAAIEFLHGLNGHPVVVEAPGGDYTPFGTISAATGLPTIIQWKGHELQWRGSGEGLDEREQAVETLYTSTAADQVLGIVQQYRVRFVIVGPKEREKYPNLAIEQMTDMFQVAKQEGQVTIYRVAPGILRRWRNATDDHRRTHANVWGERQFETGDYGAPLAVLEIALYGVIISFALGMRLWGLDSRAIHHDESLHMYYAWQIFKGDGYEHVPFMHGMLKFFGTALMFRLFGDNDFTARLLFALAGSALVGLPYFLRSYLGRIGAVVAALLLAFSPSLLYVSRFNRDDILIVGYTLAMVVVMWRYLKEQREMYLYLVPLILMLVFTTMEMTFITTAMFLVYLEFQLASDLLDHIMFADAHAGETIVAYAVFLVIGRLLALLNLIEGRASADWRCAGGGNFWVVMFIFALQLAAGIPNRCSTD
jgi:hypothetical protein